MKKIILYTVVFYTCSQALVLGQVVSSKIPGAYFKNAEKEFQDQRYIYAIPFYRASLKTGRANDSLALLHLAECYWRIKNYDSASAYYQQYENRFNPSFSSNLRLAELYAIHQQYTEAAKAYKKLLNKRPLRESALLTERLKGFSNIKPFLTDSLDFTINLLKLNTKQQDFSPQFYQWGMVFVSNRYPKPVVEREFGWDGLPYANIYWVKDTADLYLIDSMPGRSVHNYNTSIKANDDYTDRTSNDNDIINVSSMRGAYTGDMHHLAKFSDDLNSKFNYGPLCFTKSGTTVYFTRNSLKPFEGRYNLEICEAHLEKGVWTNITVLPFVQPAFDFHHPALSDDGQQLYFSSNKPGGFGGSDIYYVYIVNKTVQALTFSISEKINTAGDELFPTINGEFLYFSSDGHAGLGGLDLYKTSPAWSNWKTPVNLGYPVNSSFDDFGIIYSPSKTKGFFSSNRLGSDDIFAFTNIPFQIRLEGTVFNKVTMNRLDKAKVVITSVEDKPAIDTFITDLSGNFHFPIRPGHDYFLRFWRNGFYDDSLLVNNIGTRKVLKLSPVLLTPFPITDIQKRFNELAKMVFFKTASAELSSASLKPLNEAFDILKKHPGAILYIEGHTDNKSGAAYNKNLSQRRAASVKAFFVNKGLSAGRFTTAGYGLERPIASNATAEGRARNRRVTIKATFRE